MDIGGGKSAKRATLAIQVLALSLVAASFTTPGWKCGLRVKDCKDSMDIVLSSLISGGIACLTIGLVFNLLSMCKKTCAINPIFLVIRLLVDAASVAVPLAAVVFYATQGFEEYSYVFLICGSMLAVHVLVSTIGGLCAIPGLCPC